MTSKLTDFFLSAFLLIKATLSADIQNEQVVRAAIDIGMGGPKLHIAEIDLGTNKIVKVLHSQKYFVNFYEGISKNDNSRLSLEVMNQCIAALKDAIDVARSFKVEGIVAIATAYFVLLPTDLSLQVLSRMKRVSKCTLLIKI